MRRDMARSLHQRALAWIDARRRDGTRFRAATGSVGQPTVYFLAPDYRTPSGGTMAIYRHVDILNAAGIAAAALHWRRGFRYAWFDNETRVTTLGAARIGRHDLVVASELDVDLLSRLPPGVRHVIFNQSGHLTWDRGLELVNDHYLTNPDLAAVVTVSDHSRALVRHAFPHLDVRRIHLSLNRDLFYPAPAKRQNRIAYMPRPFRGNAELVLKLLLTRGVLDGWELVPLKGLSHSDVARQLRSTRIFLALSDQEGFGLPAAEAMACGNYVIGHHGYGGREFFDPAFSRAIETADVLAFAKAVEEVLQNDAVDPDWCWLRGQRASAHVLAEYSAERERREVVELYAGLLGVKAQASVSALQIRRENLGAINELRIGGT
ncbi:MAG: glycosyltransferase [Devosia sp.]